ncbi:MAG: sigma-54-dependent Fis family transcriptional regulator [Proteobacteria bacterium]|nr:MAG: sigma-54-dependent Fis family transcriptional regulator [Pseudomonadota bacterium]
MMKNGFKILLVEDMESFRGAVSQLLGVYSDVTEAECLATARTFLTRQSFDVVVLDKNLPDGDGVDLLTEIKGNYPNTVVIMLTSDSDFNVIKQCIALGADDYVVKTENVIPDLLVRLPLAVSKGAAARKLASLEQLVKDTFRYEIVGKSESTAELRELVLNLKGTSAHVLIAGESGTGKELIARRLNSVEDAKGRPFIAVNCGAIPENLVESELFGHKKGSFTGATNDRAGKFELAHNGDLFLDEIGELPLLAQARLLRVIQEGEVSRVGDDRIIKVNCRIIAATNRSLSQMVREGKFREDLYHRLNVINIATTPLRQRRTDIEDLAKVFTVQVGGPNFKITDKAIKALRDYDWPGNIRELRNAIERAVIACKRRKSSEIGLEEVAAVTMNEDVAQRSRKLEASLPNELGELTEKHYDEFRESLEREYLKTALELLDGNVTELANRLGLARSTAFKKLKELNVSERGFSLSKRITRSVLASARSRFDANYSTFQNKDI